MTIKARSKPYPNAKLPGTYQCGMCGITRTQRANRSGYCTACQPQARALGWIQ